MEHEGWRAIKTEIGDKEVELRPDNCSAVMFRHEPDKDYLDYWENKDDESGEIDHWWVFKRREMLIWLGGIALTKADKGILATWNDENGRFTDLSGGWRPRAWIEDFAQPYETELYTQMLLKDLNASEGVPEDF